MDYTAREVTILRSFWNRTRTVKEVAIELDISYEVCVKVVRDLVRRGAIQEIAFREGRQRKLTTVIMPDNVENLPTGLMLMPWDGKLQTIPQAVLSFSPNREVSHRYRVFALLAALEYRGNLIAEGDGAGWNSKDIRSAFIKILSELNIWRDFIDRLLKLPIWFDDPNAEKKIGTGFDPDAKIKLALEMERHFMASGKRALEE